MILGVFVQLWLTVVQYVQIHDSQGKLHQNNMSDKHSFNKSMLFNCCINDT